MSHNLYISCILYYSVPISLLYLGMSLSGASPPKLREFKAAACAVHCHEWKSVCLAACHGYILLQYGTGAMRPGAEEEPYQLRCEKSKLGRNGMYGASKLL